jgi:branched-subunit amino acid transport protein
MNTVLLIVGMAAATYALRFSGMALSQRAMPPGFLRLLRFVPLGVFTSLIVLALPGTQGEGDIRVVAALCAGVALWRWRQPWVGLLVGMTVAWLLRAVGFAML